MTKFPGIYKQLEQGWGEYYSGTRLAQNDKHENKKKHCSQVLLLEYWFSSTLTHMFNTRPSPDLEASKIWIEKGG